MADDDGGGSGRGRVPRPVQVVLVVLLVVGALVIGSRLDAGSPARPRPSASPSTETSTIAAPRADQGRLSGLTTTENEDLSRCTPGADEVASCGKAPALRGIERWFRTPGGRPVDLASLRGHVVLLEFWAYSCGACRLDQTYLSTWQRRYAGSGLRVISVQTPHWDFEADAGNLAHALQGSPVNYPVGLDADRRSFDAYRDRYWPTKYLIDETGTVRAIRFGANGYRDVEQQLRTLLREAQPDRELPPESSLLGELGDQQFDEIGFGYAADPRYVGDPGRLVHNRSAQYRFSPRDLEPSEFTLEGRWTVRSQYVQAGRGARLKVSFAAMRAGIVLAGRGTVVAHENGGPDVPVRIRGRPGSVTLFSGRINLGAPVVLDVDPGVRVYALDVR